VLEFLGAGLGKSSLQRKLPRSYSFESEFVSDGESCSWSFSGPQINADERIDPTVTRSSFMTAAGTCACALGIQNARIRAWTFPSGCGRGVSWKTHSQARAWEREKSESLPLDSSALICRNPRPTDLGIKRTRILEASFRFSSSGASPLQTAQV